MQPDQPDKLSKDNVQASRDDLSEGFTIRPVQQTDNAKVAQVIREVMTEFGAVGEGYSIGDAEVDDMYGNYPPPRSCYFVIVRDEKVLGAGGIAPLVGADKSVCELRKMFFMPSIRGLGLGGRLLKLLLEEARARNYTTCYLETLERMTGATGLYESRGFKRLEAAMGKTGHCSCDRYYALEL
jgi:putative acetyltransferase